MAKTLDGRAVRLRRVFKSKLYEARLGKDGKVLMSRVIYPSASAAGRAVCGHNVNGWQLGIANERRGIG